jgi:hypothetical protein
MPIKMGDTVIHKDGLSGVALTDEIGGTFQVKVKNASMTWGAGDVVKSSTVGVPSQTKQRENKKRE